MWEWKYAKEPLDMKLLLLRLIGNIKIVIIAALLGAAIIGGGYTVSKVVFGGPTEYEMSQRFYVQYATDPQVGLEFTYINHASWNMWVQSDWFTERVWDYTFADGLNPAQYGLTKETLSTVLSAGLETDLRVAIVTVKTTDAVLTEKLSKALAKVMQDFAQQQIEIEEIRLVDTLEVKEADKDIRALRAVILGTVVGAFCGIVGVLIYLVLDDGVYLPSTLSYRYGQPALGCAFDSPDGLKLQPGTLENIKTVYGELDKVALTAVEEDLSLPEIADLFEGPEFVCVPSLCQVPEAVEVLKQQDGVLLVVAAGGSSDGQICHVLEQMKVHDCKLRGMLLVHADKNLMKLYVLPVKGE
ncbi:MAG: hypothetical protein IJW63_07215 [Lachnospiraceae bacterium]|nr:hypothetical protein [Lachnospiraceae bacterium]